MADILQSGNPQKVKAVLRIYTKEVESTQIPQPSPINGETLEPVILEDVPCFYGQILTTSLNESLDGGISVSLNFPYKRDIPTDNTFFSNELSILKPLKISMTGAPPVFIPKPFRSSYLYKLDYIAGSLDSELQTYYDSGKTEEDLNTLYTAIDSKSKYSYWLYMTDYSINEKIQENTITLSLTDTSYKLKNNWSYLYPDDAFFSWAYAQNHGSEYWLLTEDLYNKYDTHTAVFDGWTLSGVLLSLLYYSGMFPIIALDNTETEETDENLAQITLSRTVGTNYTTYKLNWASYTKDILVVSNGINDKDLPISMEYPDESNLIDEGYYFSASPYEYMTDIIRDLENLVGFYWKMNRDGVLEVTENYYKQPSDRIKFTEATVQSLTYDYDDSNLRNDVFVFGRPFSFDTKFQGRAQDADSIEYFGRRPFVFEHNLIMSDNQAQDIADNILDTFKLNIGRTAIDQYFNTNDDETVYTGQEIILGFDDFNSEENTEQLIISDINIETNFFQKANITYSVLPKTERILIDLPDAFNNLSYIKGALDTDAINFVFNSEATADNAVNLAAGTTIDSGNSVIEQEYDWKYTFPTYTAKFVKAVDAGNITGGTLEVEVTCQSGYVISETLNLDVLKDQSGIVDLQMIARYTIVEGISTIMLTGKVGNESFFIKSYSFRNPNFDVPMKITLDLEGSQPSMTILTQQILTRDSSFFLSFDLENTSDQSGIIDAGFAVIPVAPVGRDSSGKPFAGIDFSEGQLNYSPAMFEHYDYFNVKSALMQSYNEPFRIVNGEIQVYGTIKYMGGINQAQTYSISERVNSMWYIIEANKTTEGYSVKFNPFIETSDGEVLAYSNIMLIVPFIVATGADEETRVHFKNQMFIIHNNFDETNAIEFRGVTQGNNDVMATSDSYTCFGLLYGNTFRYYPVGITGNAIQDTYLDITGTTIDSKIKYFYKSKYPFNNRFALSKGDRFLERLQGANLNQLIMLNKPNLPNSESFTSIEEEIFNSPSAVDFLQTVEEEWTATKYKYPVIILINPFYRFGLTDYIENYVGESELYQDTDCRLLALFGIASSTGTTINSNSLATFTLAENSLYADKKDERTVNVATFQIDP